MVHGEREAFEETFFGLLHVRFVLLCVTQNGRRTDGRNSEAKQTTTTRPLPVGGVRVGSLGRS